MWICFRKQTNYLTSKWTYRATLKQSWNYPVKPRILKKYKCEIRRSPPVWSRGCDCTARYDPGRCISFISYAACRLRYENGLALEKPGQRQRNTTFDVPDRETARRSRWCWNRYCALSALMVVYGQEQSCCRVADLYSYIEWGWCWWTGNRLTLKIWWLLECSFWHCWHSYLRTWSNALRHRKTTPVTLASNEVVILCYLFIIRSTPCGRLLLFY